MTIDADVRHRALTLNESFIVQAPAGSGKTELLTQRYLGLLATVEQPEEVLAITFTRKAAAEMKERILETLTAVEQGQEAPPHRRPAFEFAKKVLQNNEKFGWHILEQPGQLQVKTIDSLCSWIVQQMPISAQCSSKQSVSTDNTVFKTAARSTVLNLLSDKDSSLLLLLNRLGGKTEQLITLLANMLSERSHWLHYGALLFQSDDAAVEHHIESAFEKLAEKYINILLENLPASLLEDLFTIAGACAAMLNAQKHSSQYEALMAVEEPMHATTIAWQALSMWLLKSDGLARKTLTKREGFEKPPSGKFADGVEFKERKARFIEISEFINEQESCLHALSMLKLIPDNAVISATTPVSLAACHVFKHLVAELMVVFSSERTVDFVELSMRALQALGDDLLPSDLALRLDHQISHILVDEFQDTSLSQVKLLEKLSYGWQPTDGRTLFLVGDPMQSIYRFRQADVSLFLKVQDEGIGSTQVTPLKLRANFRSNQGIVNWVNQTFTQVFPHYDSLAEGAVAYSASVPASENDNANIIQRGFISALDEAEYIVEEIVRIQSANPDESIAILVRSRAILKNIVAALNRRSLTFQATDIDSLASKPIVSDLFSLTSALLHWHNDVAWIAVLRAPWCGLPASDIHAICRLKGDLSVIEALQNDALRIKLSDRGGQRVSQFVDAILPSLVSESSNASLHDKVKLAFNRLGAAEYFSSEEQQSDAIAFFELLDEISVNGDIVDSALLQEKTELLFAKAMPSNIQLMTIHKSKGLEFDHVFLPGLERIPRNNDAKLLSWCEFINDESEPDLLISPVQDFLSEDSTFVDFINALNRVKDRHEARRLLYVAATRAKTGLYLTATTKSQEAMKKQPSSSTLLGMLWPALQWQYPIDDEVECDDSTLTVLPQHYYRVPESDLTNNPMPDLRKQFPLTELKASSRWSDLVDPTHAREFGIVMHKLLYEWATAGDLSTDIISNQTKRWLREEGVPELLLDSMAGDLLACLAKVKADKRGQWILAKRDEAWYEYGLNGFIDNQVIIGVIDCVFIDDNTCWIVDYKSAEPAQGQSLDAFYKKQKAEYQEQLTRYAKLMSLKQQHPVRVGLYFPKFCGWEEWAVC